MKRQSQAQLTNELAQLRQRAADLEALEVERKQFFTVLTTLNDFVATIEQSLGLDHFLDTVLDKVLDLIGAVKGRIRLYHNGNDQSQGGTELVIEREVDQVEASDLDRLDIPIVAHGTVLGELALFSQSLRKWTDQDPHLLKRIGYEIGLGIANVRLFEAVEQQRLQLRTLGMRLVEAEETERRRLARELHDQVGQSLTAMGINLDIIRTLLPIDSSEELIFRLDDMRQLVTRTTKRVRQVMVDLRPEMLDDYGILAALYWSAERFTQRTGISVVVKGDETEKRLPRQVENVFYRITQEALTNIAKHARATQVTVRLKLAREMVTLVVADNGVGFNPEHRASLDNGQHWGLNLMAERVESINGRFRLDSAPGQGTRIIVEVPR